MATEMVKLFKSEGYKTTLIYFGLDSLIESRLRVKQRTVEGGHDVKPDVLKYNFDEGPKRVSRDLPLFDIVVFADLRNKQMQILSATDNKQQLQYTVNNNVKWYTESFKSKLERPELKQVTTISDVLPRRRRRLGL